MAAKLKTEAPEQLELEAKQRIRAWAERDFPFLSRAELREQWERCRDWHLMHNEKRANWEAAFRNWLRKAREFSLRDHQGARLASRTIARSRDVPPGALEPIGELLKLIRGDS